MLFEKPTLFSKQSWNCEWETVYERFCFILRYAENSFNFLQVIVTDTHILVINIQSITYPKFFSNYSNVYDKAQESAFSSYS